jgi:polyisoprenoid-binding protein YceI
MSPTKVDSLPETGTWAIDSHHSTVNFSVRHHAVATFRSTYVNISGAFDGDEQKLAGEVDASSITLTGLDQLKGHILTPDFFNAEEFPTFSFESTRIARDGEALTVEGDLTLRGVTKRIVASGTSYGPRTVQSARGPVNERFGIDIETIIDRRDFGISFNNEISEGVVNLGWDVRIEAALEFVLQEDRDEDSR